MQVEEAPRSPSGPTGEAGSLPDVYRVIDSLRGRSLEEEIAGLRRAREKLLAAVPTAAERARLAELSVDKSEIQVGDRDRGAPIPSGSTR